MQARALVGRDGELAVVGSFLDSLASGPRTFVLEGEPGIGKTTLWEECVRRAGDSGIRVLTTRPGPSEARLTFVGLADLKTAPVILKWFAARADVLHQLRRTGVGRGFRPRPTRAYAGGDGPSRPPG